MRVLAFLDEELKAVFDSFVQGKKTKTGKGGTGLGLAICDHIIKAHGGRIGRRTPSLKAPCSPS